MSRSNRNPPYWTIAPRAAPGRARGVSKLRRLLGRAVRRTLNRVASTDEAQLNQPKKIKNFWWEFW